MSGCFNWRLTRYASSVKEIHQYFIQLLSFQCFLTTISFGESFRFELALWYHARDTVITTPCQRWGAHTVGSNPVSDSECKLSFTHAAWKLEKQFSHSGWLKRVRALSDELPSCNDDMLFFNVVKLSTLFACLPKHNRGLKEQHLWAMDVNRKWTYCIIGEWFGSNSQVNRLYKRKKLNNINLLVSRHIYSEKASVPVDVRRSKTSLLKFPNNRKRPEAFGINDSLAITGWRNISSV